MQTIQVSPAPADTDSMVRQLTQDFTSAATRLNKQKLTLNIQETIIMVFGPSHKINDYELADVAFGNEKLEVVDRYKYLGIMLEKTLKFDQNVKYLHRMIYRKLKTLGRVRSQIGQFTAILYNIYKSPLYVQ